MSIQNVNWFELAKYFAVMMTQERQSMKITVNYWRQKKNPYKWLPARRPGVRQKNKMLALAVSYGVETAMSHHCR